MVKTVYEASLVLVVESVGFVDVAREMEALPSRVKELLTPLGEASIMGFKATCKED